MPYQMSFIILPAFSWMKKRHREILILLESLLKQRIDTIRVPPVLSFVLPVQFAKVFFVFILPYHFSDVNIFTKKETILLSSLCALCLFYAVCTVVGFGTREKVCRLSKLNPKAYMGTSRGEVGSKHKTFFIPEFKEFLPYDKGTIIISSLCALILFYAVCALFTRSGFTLP